ncbi:MAG: DUF5666 domain-containing protein [bacterium]|nr:DUF5666 domain-containing protein [bacterium]
MRKKIFLLTAAFITFLFVVTSGTWAELSSSDDSSRNLQVTPRVKQNILQRSSTPPGLLRQRIATPEGKANLPRRHVYVGTVSGILSASQSFTLDTRGGLKTVQTNGETKFFQGRFKGGETVSFDSLKKDDRVVAVGWVDNQGLMTARWVIIMPVKKEVKRHAVYGVVEQKLATGSATLLILRHPQNQKAYQVLVNGQTKITGKNLTNPTIGDIQIGSRITAVGTVDDGGKITAKNLHIIPGQARGFSNGERITPGQTLENKRKSMITGVPPPLPSPKPPVRITQPAM